MPVDVIPGDSPLIITLPHAATDIPNGVMQRLNETGRALTDTHWHIDRLFAGLVDGVTVIRANFHRYMCNANGNPAHVGAQFGWTTDAIVPMCNLDGESIWDAPPDQAEMGRWRAAFHAPYQATIAAQVAQTRAQHGHALLIDCHAVRPGPLTAPRHALPDIGIRTENGSACDPRLAAHLSGICMSSRSYTTAIDDGPKGGWTVRRYGRPKQNVHALQLDIALSTYLTEEAEPWLYDPQSAERLRAILGEVLAAAQRWQPRRMYYTLAK